jgi:hypothetical protein
MGTVAICRVLFNGRQKWGEKFAFNITINRNPE